MSGVRVYRDGARRRKPWKVVLFAAAVLLVLVLVAAQLVCDWLYRENFDLRFESGTSIQLSDFPDLEQEAVAFASDRGQKLHGDFLWNDSAGSPKAVVVWNHGYGGGGYRWYLSQIDYLAQNGYLVFAFDKTGNDASGGDGVRGLPQGVIDTQYAVETVQGQPRSRDLPVFLYGHSWGGYSSCAVLEYAPEVQAVVSLSGFNESKDMLIDQGTELYGSFVPLMSPFLTVSDLLRFGSHAFDSSLKGLAATQAEVLLFHSADDPVIRIEGSLDRYQRELGDRENLHFVRMDGKGHNVMQDGDGLDLTVMRRIVEFYDNVAAKE